MVVGTFEYISPEQVRAEEVDPRADLFSFGLVLCEMATGRRAFAGNSPGAIFDAILNRAPLSPLRVNPELPVPLEGIIAKALERDRRLRLSAAPTIGAVRERRQNYQHHCNDHQNHPELAGCFHVSPLLRNRPVKSAARALRSKSKSKEGSRQ